MRRLFSFLRDRRGMAATEFAIVAPVMIMLYLGGYKLTDGIALSRRVTVTTRTIADLTSQYTSVKESTMQTVLKSSSQVMAPYSPAGGTYTVTLIVTDNKGVSKVGWSRKLIGATVSTGAATGTTVTLPANIARPSSSVVLAEISYPYSVNIPMMPSKTITMSDRIFMFPRSSDTIPMEQ